MRDYLQHLEHEGKDRRGAEYSINAHVLPKLGTIECSKLKSPKIRGWMSGLASAPGRLRPKKGKQQYRKFDSGDAEEVRKRKATANRVLDVLKAALTLGFEEGRIATDAEWRRVKRYDQVNTARIRFLTVAEARRLINACDPEFRPMAEAALATGCRYGELCRLEVHDFDPDTETLSIRKSKGGKARKVYLGAEGMQLFERLTAGRLGGERLIRMDDGRPFAKSYQIRPMRAACLAAKITPAVGFHQLRHTFASLLVKSGTPMRYVADALGHATTAMVERYYAHLAPSHVADTIRKNAPVFGLGTSNVVGLR
jgi:integrase